MGLPKDLGLAQPGASLADAAADWMRGPPLTDCWRLDLCVPGRPKPPLCLALPPWVHPSHRRIALSLSLQFFLFLLILVVRATITAFCCASYTCRHARSKNTPAAGKHTTQRTHCVRVIQKWSASNVAKQMAETNFSLFADSCATSCNKKSMNQGQSIYSNNKDWEICHFPTPCLFSSLTWEELGGGGVKRTHKHSRAVC